MKFASSSEQPGYRDGEINGGLERMVGLSRISEPDDSNKGVKDSG